ncbi:hypothetical protein QYE76_033169 [Lolium multiflorum]|uniref:Uncharacterized protein n=1 Tax=Lolium multiflorum TaxID=4521 RepID=A0AAD8QV49_LOLMU|nr:hypothetical protein QYE76_033169 [Lolium multiflorum]
MWKRRREQRTHALVVLREVPVPMWYRRRTSNLTSLRIGTMEKASLTRRTKPPTQPTSKGRLLIRRKGTAMFVALGHWAPDCPERHDRRGNSGKSANVVIGVDTEMKDVGYGISPTVLSVARTSSVLMGNGSRASVRGVGTVDLKFTSGKTIS